MGAGGVVVMRYRANNTVCEASKIPGEITATSATNGRIQKPTAGRNIQRIVWDG